MNSLLEITPRKRLRVMDLVEDTGIDVSDWKKYSKGLESPGANPKYCYEWSFVCDEQNIIVLNLWHHKMQVQDNEIIYHLNPRKAAETEVGVRKARAEKMNQAIQKAVNNSLWVRIIVLGRSLQNEKLGPTKRLLDDEVWTVTSYDAASGDCTLTRGTNDLPYGDQFDLSSQPVSRKSVSGEVFTRKPGVRKQALRRSQGKCERCKEPGFLMPNGKRFLETHHIQPLSEGGADNLLNVIALCPNHHREAHYGDERQKLREEMLSLVKLLTEKFCADS